MSEDGAINCLWDGESFSPVSQFWSRRADKQFVVGQKYMVEARQERPDATHRHYFAAVKECWENLPDDKREQYSSPEHLRHWALIKCGYRNERHIVCGSAVEASRIAAFIAPMDPYAVVVAKKNVVHAFTAKSQSYRAMDKVEFAASKTAVLEALAELIGVTAEDLQKNAGQAA